MLIWSAQFYKFPIILELEKSTTPTKSVHCIFIIKFILTLDIRKIFN